MEFYLLRPDQGDQVLKLLDQSCLKGSLKGLSRLDLVNKEPNWDKLRW